MTENNIEIDKIGFKPVVMRIKVKKPRELVEDDLLRYIYDFVSESLDKGEMPFIAIIRDQELFSLLEKVLLDADERGHFDKLEKTLFVYVPEDKDAIQFYKVTDSEIDMDM